MLLPDARNYYTVVDRTLNEWSEWQPKNLNAIVRLSRGEMEKYAVLLEEYRAALQEYTDEKSEYTSFITQSSFADAVAFLKEGIKAQRTAAKKEIESADRKA